MIVKVRKLREGLYFDTCLLPRYIFELFKLSNKKAYKIRVGQLWVDVLIELNDTSKEEIYFPKEIFDRLLLYSEASLNIWLKDDEIHLGPVVGVFVNTRYLNAIAEEKPPLSAQKNMQANQKGNCLLYYFSLENINWVEKTIKGYVLAPRWGEWKHYWFPMPDVIYDRGVGFDDNQKLLARHIRKQFDYHPSIHFINNQDYLGKWQTYKWLVNYAEIKEYFPETFRYTCFRDLDNLLKRLGFVFLKSYYGSRGQEVMSVEELKKGYKVTHYKGGHKEYNLASLEELKDCVESYIGEKNFIIQQGIRLFKIDERPIDMRILIAKNKQGQWTAIYNQVRMAKESCLITNESAEGELSNYKKIYSYLNSVSTVGTLPTDSALREVAIKIATYIEKEFGEFGELGMDMAVGEEGKIWFIEANTKSDKDPVPGLEDTEGISPQFLAVLEYAQFLAQRG